MMPLALAALVVLLRAPAPGPADLVVPKLQVIDDVANDEEPVTRPCQLGQAATSLTLTVKDVSEGHPEIAAMEQQVTLTGGPEDVLVLDRKRSNGEAPLPSLRLRCAPGQLTIDVPGGSPLVFVADPKGALHASDATLAEATRLEEAAQRSAPDRARIEALWQLIDPSAWGIDAPYWQTIGLAKARAAIETDHFTVADEVLGHLDASPRKDAVRAALEARRTATQPYRAVDGTRIGTIPLAALQTPDAPDADDGEAPPPAVFWLHDAFCVLQNDHAGPMRCYDVQKRAWGKKEPVPKGIPRPPTESPIDFGSVGSKDGKTHIDVNAFDAAVSEGWLGVAKGRIWLARGVTADTNGVLIPLTPDQASARIAKSNGTPYFGHARFTFLQGNQARDAAPLESPEQSWHVLPPAPSGLAWWKVWVSPDQGFVAALAQNQSGATQGTLFVFKLAPVEH